MRIRPEVLLLAIVLPLAACKDYGEYTVAEREWVENDELPALSEMDLTGIDLEFSIGSEAHARVLPEVDWPDPVGALMDRVEFENGGSLPSDFDLPLEDGCMYVGLEPRYSRFRRVEIQGQVLLFVTYLVRLKDSGQKEGGASSGVRFEARLAVIDESLGMKRYDFEIDSLQFQIVQTASTFGIISSGNRSIHLRRLHFEGNTLIANEPVRLASSDHSIDKMAIATEPDGTFHLAWLTYDRTTTTENPVYYSKYGPDGDKLVNRNLLSEDARYRFIAMHWSTSGAAIAWADSRFARYGFSYSNLSKIFVHIANPEDRQSRGPYALNVPFQDSDDAFRPIFAIPHNDAIAFLWGKTSSDSLDKADKQFGIFDVKNKSLSLAKTSIRHEDVISTALQQQIEHQRSMPIAGFPVPDPDECDNWQARLNLKPTGVGIMTPEGMKPITRLILEPKDDDSDGDSDGDSDDNSTNNRRD